MPFSPQSLAVLARNDDFTLWRYECAEDPADLLAAGYFLPVAGILRRGDLVSCVGAGTNAAAGQRTALLVADAGPGRVVLEPLQSLPPAALAALADVRVGEAKADEVLTFADGGWTNRPAPGRAGDAFAAAHAGAAGAEAHAMATPACAGFMAAADKQKLDRIEAAATADQTGAELVEAIDGELGGADWREDASAWGAFHGKTLGSALVERDGAIDVDVATVVASVPRTRAISAPAGEDPSISLELPAAVDRRDFLLGFTATGAVTTTKVATAAEVDALVSQGIRVVPTMADLRQRPGWYADELVWLSGYWSAGDGGEGMFQWDTAASEPDNGGTVLALSTNIKGRWKRVSGSVISVRWFGATGGGTVDDTAAFVAAMECAAGTLVRIPTGRYLLKDCFIPSSFGCDLRPDGSVQILTDRSSTTGALVFHGQKNIDLDIAIAGVSAFTEGGAPRRRIDGDFSGFIIGDVCKIYSENKITPGVYPGEYFLVTDVSSDSSHIITDRELQHSYSPGARLLRLKSTPKVIIHKGIEFRPAGDPTTLGPRKPHVVIHAAVAPWIEFHYKGTWNSALELYGVLNGRISLTFDDVHVDYAASAYGYGVVVTGCQEVDVSLNGASGGHAYTAAVGYMSGFSETNGYRYGFNTANVVRDSIVLGTVRAAFDQHGGWCTRFVNCHGRSTANARSVNNACVFSDAGYSTTFSNCSGDLSGGFIRVGQANYGGEDVLSIIDCQYDGGFSSDSDFLKISGPLPLTKKIIVHGGQVRKARTGVGTCGYRCSIIVTGLVLINCGIPFRMDANEATLEIIDALIVAGEKSGYDCFYVSSTGIVRVASLTVSPNSLNKPLNVFNCTVDAKEVILGSCRSPHPMRLYNIGQKNVTAADWQTLKGIVG